MTSPPSWTRTETDELGSRRLPGEALYGIHTLRAAENFPVSGLRLGALMPPVRALAPAGLSPEGLAYLEAPSPIADLAGWHVLRRLKAGNVHAHLLQKTP